MREYTRNTWCDMCGKQVEVDKEMDTDEECWSLSIACWSERDYVCHSADLCAECKDVVLKELNTMGVTVKRKVE